MRKTLVKIILYVIGAAIAGFGALAFVLCFVGPEAADAGPGTKFVCFTVFAIGVVIIVVNTVFKPQDAKCLKGVKEKISFDERRVISRYKKGKCPHCGAALEHKGIESDGSERYDCKKGHVSFLIKRNGSFTVETDANGEQVLVSHDTFPRLLLNKRQKDSDGEWSGTIYPEESEILDRVFELLTQEWQCVYDKDSPEVKQAIVDAKTLDDGRCPICNHVITDRKEYVPGNVGSFSKEYEPAFIPSLGGAVFIEREVCKGSTPGRYVTVTSCEAKCHTKNGNRERIARALAFRKRENPRIDTMLSNAGYKFKIKQ